MRTVWVATLVLVLVLAAATVARRSPFTWGMFAHSDKALLWDLSGPASRVLLPEEVGMLPDTENLALRHLRSAVAQQACVRGFDGWVLSSRRGCWHVRLESPGGELMVRGVSRTEAYQAISVRLAEEWTGWKLRSRRPA